MFCARIVIAPVAENALDFSGTTSARTTVSTRRSHAGLLLHFDHASEPGPVHHQEF
jgi:hypothetical protein